MYFCITTGLVSDTGDDDDDSHNHGEMKKNSEWKGEKKGKKFLFLSLRAEIRVFLNKV